VFLDDVSRLIKEFHDLTIETNSKMDTIIQLSSRRVQSKIGSKLGSAELKTFVHTLLPIQLLIEKHQNHRLLGHVSNLVVKFNSTLNDLKANQSECAEVPDIQPKTAKLFNGFVDGLDGLLKLYDLNSSVTMHTGEDSKTEYVTNILILGHKPLDVVDEHIGGRTDKSFFYLNCPAGGVFEDKNIGVKILEPQWESQIFSQIKGFAEQFLAACSVQPKRFVGILSNAEQFCLYYRRFHNGNLTWHRTELVNFTDIRLAAIVLIEFMENICDAIKVIDYSLKKVVQAVDEIALLADIFDEDQDEEDDGFGDFVNSASGYTKSSNNITTSRVTAAKKTGNFSNKENTGSKGKSGSSAKSGSKRRPLTAIDLNDMNFRNEVWPMRMVK